MKLPNVWGQGSVFSYSGLEGECTFDQSIPATLLGDNLGIRIHAEDQYDLYVSLKGIADIRYEMIDTDLILGELTDEQGKNYQTVFTYWNQNTIVGRCRKGAACIRAVNSVKEKRVPNGLEFQSEHQKMYYQEFIENQYTYFTFSSHRDMRITSAKLESLVSDKMRFYEELPGLTFQDEEVERTFYKCISVMKSQVYTSQGIFHQKWTTPDKIPHKKLWLWDSVFHSLGNWFLSEELAEESIMSVFDTQTEDGFIPHMSTPDIRSNKAQPPILAYGSLRLYQRNQDSTFLEKFYNKLETYLVWHMTHRRNPQTGLFMWHVNADRPENRCDESGMDNSPRFDHVSYMDCIDYSCFMVKEAESMNEITQILHRSPTIDWGALADELKEKINTYLWDEKEQFYYDRIVQDQRLNKVNSIASFLPLFAGVCSKDQAEALVHELLNQNTFWEQCGVASVSKKDQTFGTDMWRGPVWINYNYLIIIGLRRYGYDKIANQLTRKIIHTIANSYLQDGVLFEFYPSGGEQSPSQIMRKGPVIKPYNFDVRLQCVRDFGWTASLYAALVLESGLFSL